MEFEITGKPPIKCAECSSEVSVYGNSYDAVKFKLRDMGWLVAYDLENKSIVAICPSCQEDIKLKELEL